MPNREIKLQLAVEKLRRYYDLLTTRNLSNYIGAGGTGVTAIGETDPAAALGVESSAPTTSPMSFEEDSTIGEIVNAFLDVTLGVYTTKELLNFLATRFGVISAPTGEDASSVEALQNRYKQLFHIVSDAQYANEMPFPEFLERMKNASIRELISDTNLIATGTEEPSKRKPGLSVILSQTSRISLSNRFANACSLFFNAIPTIEISKAVPYLEVNILIPDVAVERNDSSRLVSPTIYKFLLGGVQAPTGSVLNTLSIGNEQSRTPVSPDRPSVYTNVGMEAFLMPQTLVNPDAAENRQNFGNAVTDKFRPFMSIKEATFTEVQSYAAYGYQTAKLSLVLHDRSRLNEIAQFVRPSFGNTEIVLEWGWCHSESENSSDSKNVFADLINGMRKRTKCQVTNSSFSFDDNGQVNIELDLATIGELGLTTESISTDDVNVTNSLNAINNIIELIGTIRNNNRFLNSSSSTESTTTTGAATTTPNSNTTRPSGGTEIRGIQFLNTASETYSNLVLTREQREELNTLQTSLRTLPQTEDIRNLRYLLEELYGSGSGSSGHRRSGNATTPITERLRSQIQHQIRERMATLKKGLEDPFLIGTYNPVVDRRNRALNTPGRPSRIDPREEVVNATIAINRERISQINSEIANSPGRAAIADQREIRNRIRDIDRRLRELRGLISMTNSESARRNWIAERTTLEQQRTDLNFFYNEDQRTLERGAPAIEERLADRAHAEANLETLENTSAQLRALRESYPDRLRAWRSSVAASSPVPRGAVSLANLLTVFMGRPLAATGQFDDVQLVFYPFNEYAGFARYINTANFIINIEDFQQKYTDYRLQNISRDGQFTIRQFWTFLTSNIIDDPSQASYGLVDTRGHSLYVRETREEEGRTVTNVVPAESDGARFNSRLNEVLQNVTPDGSFRTPQLNFIIECLPGRISSDGENMDIANEKTIARVHIFDQRTTPYEGLGAILQAQRNGMLEIPNHSRTESAGSPDVNTGDVSLVNLNSQENYQQFLRQAEATGLVARAPSGGYEIVGGPDSIKSFLYHTTPYIIHGAKNSLIRGANLSTITDQAANTLAIVRAPTGNEALRPNGQDLGNLPMQILPTELNVDCYGCPLLGFSSQFFIDFNTNTTADDIYMVNGIDHKISQGEYTTNIKFVALSSYGQYRNYINELNSAVEHLREMETSRTGEPPTPSPAEVARERRSARAREAARIRREDALLADLVAAPEPEVRIQEANIVGNPLINRGRVGVSSITIGEVDFTPAPTRSPDAPRAPEPPSAERVRAAEEDRANREVNSRAAELTRQENEARRTIAAATAALRGAGDSAAAAGASPPGATGTRGLTPTTSTTATRSSDLNSGVHTGGNAESLVRAGVR